MEKLIMKDWNGLLIDISAIVPSATSLQKKVFDGKKMVTLGDLQPSQLMKRINMIGRFMPKFSVFDRFPRKTRNDLFDIRKVMTIPEASVCHGDTDGDIIMYRSPVIHGYPYLAHDVVKVCEKWMDVGKYSNLATKCMEDLGRDF